MSMLKLEVNKIREKLKSLGKYRIAFVGDSLTSCEWVHPNWREIVEYVLKDKLQNEFEVWKVPSWGIRCFNFGFDGATTKDILGKADEILEVKSDLIICMLGGNDPILGISIEEHGKNMKEISKRFGGIIMTNTKPDNDKAAKRYEPYVKQVVKQKLSRFINMFDLFKPEARFFTFKSEENPEEGLKMGDRDYCHPNQLGNAYIAKIVLKEVFDTDFDPEEFMKTTLSGEKYPKY